MELEREVWQAFITNSSGDVQPNAQITVFDAGTSNLSTIYSGLTGAPRPNPFNTGSDGLAKFYAEPARYRVQAQTPAGIAVFDDVDLSQKALREDLADPDSDVLIAGKTAKDVSALREDLANPESEVLIAGEPAKDVAALSVSVSDKLRSLPVTPEEFGAVGDGVTDDSAAVIAATQASNHVLFTSQEGYVVQGLPIRTGLVYEGVGDVTLHLPESPSDHMFKTSGSDDTILSGGIVRLKLDGGRTQTYNGADFTSIHSRGMEVWSCEDVRFDGFNRGFNGTNGDRMAAFRNCRFINNVIGARGGEHPLFIGCDFRANDIGLAGRFNDLKVSDCKFTYNRIGSAADPDGGQLTNSSFTGCQFYSNYKSGLEVGSDVSITGCLIVGGGPGSVGVILTHGYENTITGCLFGQVSEGTISDHHIVVPPDTSVQSGFLTIADNVFRHSSGASIKLDSPLNTISISGNAFSVLNNYCIDADVITESSITGNSARIGAGGVGGFMDARTLRSSTVSANSIRTSSSSPAIYIRESPGLGLGSSYIGNTFSKAGQIVGDVFSGHIHGSVFSGNILTGASKLRLTSLEWGSVPPVLTENIGFKIYQNRATTPDVGVTEWDVSFDIDTDVEVRNITLQPLNEAAANSMAYVVSVDNAAKTFTIRFAGTVSGIRTFGVQIRAFGA